MLQGKQLKQSYNDYIINYSLEKGLQKNSVQNKKDILGKLLPFLADRSLTFEICRDYSFFLFDHGWERPNSRVSIIKNLRAFVNFLYKQKYIKENFAQELAKPTPENTQIFESIYTKKLDNIWDLVKE